MTGFFLFRIQKILPQKNLDIENKISTLEKVEESFY